MSGEKNPLSQRGRPAHILMPVMQSPNLLQEGPK